MKLFTLFIVILTLCSLSLPIGRLIQSHALQRTYYFWFPNEGFDFYDYQVRMQSLRQPNFFSLPGYPWYYPAAGILAYDFFYHLCFGGDWRVGYIIFGCIVLAGCLFASLRFSSALERLGFSRFSSENVVFISLLCSWPIYFSLQRGNLESFFWLLLAVAIFMLHREQWLRGAIILGIAAAFKLYPALCFALFLRARRWKELAIGLLTMALTTLLGLRYLEADIVFAARKVFQGIQQWTQDYAGSTSADQMMYDHSAYEILKALFQKHHQMLHGYLIVTATVMTLLFLLRVIRLPRSNQILFLITGSVLIPPASFDYTLQSMHIAWAWIVLDIASSKSKEGVWPSILMGLFALVLAPLGFTRLHGESIGGVIKGFALVGIVLIAVLVPICTNHQWRVAQSAEC